MRKIDSLLRKTRKSRNPDDWVDIKRERNNVCKQIRRAKDNYFNTKKIKAQPKKVVQPY